MRANYTYDGRSRLAIRQILNATPSGTTHLIHDRNDRIIVETDGVGTSVREYVWLDDLPVAVLDGSSAPANPTLLWVHADHLNRPILMTDGSKAVVWKALYEPFGAVHAITGPAANDMRFPGQWFQLESGLHYNWHRHYDPTLGRYTQPDPLGLAALHSDGPSLYGYAGLSPVLNTDPSGQLIPVLLGAAVGAGIGYLIDTWVEGCTCQASHSALARYTGLGASTGLFAATDRTTKPQFPRLGGGGRSGDWTSEWSKLVGPGPARRFGRRVAGSLPYVGFYMVLYDVYRVSECFR